MNITKNHYLIIGLIVIIFAGVFLITGIKPAQEEKSNVQYYAFSEAEPDLKTASFDDAVSANLQLTLYNQGFGLIKEAKTFDLKQGANLVDYENVADTIESDTLLYEDKEGKTKLEEFTYNYDTANNSALLQKSLDKTIKVETKQGKGFEGKLLSYGDSILLETASGIVSVLNAEIENINFGQISDLKTKPTIKMKVWADAEGQAIANLAYMATGLGWETKYVSKLSDETDKITLDGWVLMKNNSGKNYDNAKVKLVAGEVNKAQNYYAYDTMSKSAAMPEAASYGAGISEQAVFEYHLYSLKNLVTIMNKEEKEFSMLVSKDIPIIREYIVNNYSDKVNAIIKFKNSEESNLGVPLPAGTIKFYKEDSEGSIQFIGEDSITHTPKDKEVELSIGTVFDITADSKETKTEKVGQSCEKNYYETKILNSKDNHVTIYVKQSTYGDSKVTESSHTYEQEDSQTLKFTVPVKAGKEEKLTYAILRCW
ncbi:MAG: hypothetical protein COT15_01410 [Candidatus Diapherotrites archaeon CG08_land_8_20_14_0_20_34_12]|nr:MAG: hypothetical protein COT15_01410 [Candidatus Diapherotrites archaeon CG08_land_8_20_14_0_20_34_12]